MVVLRKVSFTDLDLQKLVELDFGSLVLSFESIFLQMVQPHTKTKSSVKIIQISFKFYIGIGLLFHLKNKRMNQPVLKE